MTTYTQPAGTAAGDQYYQDVELTPANVASGAIKQRLDPKRYPKVGTDQGAQAGGITPTVTVTASNSAPAAGASVTLTATVTGARTGHYPKGSVEFFDGVTSLGIAQLGAAVASLVVAGGFLAGAHSITAHFAGDGLYDAATSAAHTVTAT